MSIEQHGLKFTVDTTGVAKGFRDYKSAVEGIFASLDKFEAHVAKTMKGVSSAANNKAALNSFKNAVNSFSDVKINPNTAKAVGALSVAMKDFRAPSAQQSANLKKFFGALGSLPNLTSAYRTIKSIDDLNVAMRGFKAPPVSQAKNLVAFANAINTAVPKIKGITNIGNLAGAVTQINTLGTALQRLKVPTAAQISNLGNFALALRSFNFGNLAGSGNLFATLAGLSNFKAPTAGQTKNLANFIHTIGTMTVPQNAAAVARYLRQIADAAARVQGSLGGLRSGFNAAGSSMNGFSRGANHARLQMMGLQNAFSGTFQIGSALRTLFGSLTIGELGREFFEANNAMLKFNAQMSVVSKETSFAGLQMDYIRKTASAFGIDVSSAGEGFAKISIAADKSGLSVMQTRNIFEGFSTAMTVLGTTVAGQGDVWLALQQVMNKGYLSAEELNQQMNEKLPGAMAYATEYAKKLGMTLETGLKKKALEAGDVLGYIAKRYKEDFGPSVAAALQKPAAQMTILKNNITGLYQTIGAMGVNDAVATFLGRLNEGLDPANVQTFAAGVADSLVAGIDKAADAVVWLRQNWDELKGPIGTALSLMGKWMILSGSMAIGRSLIGPLIALRGSLVNLTAGFTGATASGGALRGMMASLTAGTVPLMTGIAALNVRTNAAILSQNLLTGAMNATRMAGRGVASIFGGVLATGMLMAAGGAVMLYNEYSQTQAAIKGSQATIKDTNDLIETLGIYSKKAGDNTQTLGNQHANAAPQITSFAGEVGAAAQALWEMARAQRAANLSKMMGQMDDLAAKGEELWSNTSAGMRDSLNTPVTGIVDFGKKLGKATVFGYNQAVTGGKAATESDRQFVENSRAQQRLAAAMKKYNAFGPDGKPSLENEVDPGMRRIVANGRTIEKVPPKGDGGKGAKKAFSALQGFENSLDSLLSKLEGSDPVGKIVRGWSNTVNDFAKLMLDRGAYMKAIDEAQDPHAKTALLIKELQGGNVNKTAAKGLAARGMTVDDLIEDLRQADDALDDKILDAMNKRMEQKLKGISTVMARLAEDDPTLKIMTEFNSDLSSQSKGLLNRAGFAAMLPVLEGLTLGTVNATDATAAFAAQIAAGNTRTALSAEVQGKLKTALDNTLGAFNRNTKAAQEAATFGLLTMRQRMQEIDLLRLTETQQKAVALTQQAVNDAISAGKPASQEAIDAFYQKAIAAETLNKQLERQKAFMENNGIRSYIGGLQSLGEAINDLDKNVLQSLEDQLVSLGKSGQFSFKAIFDTVNDGILKWAAGGVTTSIVNVLKPGAEKQVANGQNPSIFGGLLSSITGEKYEAPGDRAAQLGLDVGSATRAGMWVGIVNPDGLLSVSRNPDYAPYMQSADGGGLAGGAGRALGGAAKWFGGAAGDAIGAAGNLIKPVVAPVVSGIGQFATGVSNGVGLAGTDRALPGMGGAGIAANDNNAITGIAGVQATAATAAVTKSFTQNMAGAMPMLGMAFAATFKSPIAQVGAAFASMMLSKMMASQGAGAAGGGGGGIGGFFKSLIGAGAAQLIGGGGITAASTQATQGAAQSVIAANPGIFREGGGVGAPVQRMTGVSPAAFANAPHYKEGTHNTSGIPAVLHDNEAVIPLSRGRKVPVEMTGSAAGGKGTVVNNNFTINTPDANSFKKSRQQIATDQHVQASRAWKRNG